ncbi:MAG: glycosyltransferase [Ignavibacteriae bacterium]|nr:glycosyltransferase [Ignavibacteriota bacterium]MCB0752496.1 glycosyltransferase [Ignavibacteriota bacterium]MCB9211161.1 glycosyltransferase [Ignavibacteriales bacterium]MCB9247709.1 glycosyltransferase [Ignavibacteriales bacterium]
MVNQKTFSKSQTIESDSTLTSTKVENVFFVLPAYNEEESLPNLLRRIAELKSSHNVKVNVVVVNDGSADNTADVTSNTTENLNLTLVNHEKNMGLGQAVQTGIKEALSQANHNDIVIIMDADDTHDVTLMDQMITKIEAGADIVIASRFVAGGNDESAPPFRRLLSRGASFVFKTLLPLNDIQDFTSGYRAYRVSLLQKVSFHYGETLIHEQGFACMVELLLKLRHWSPKIVEIPFFLRYDRKLGASKLKLSKTMMQYLKLGIRDRVSPSPRRI